MAGKVTPDKFVIRVRGDDLDEDAFRDAIEQLRELEFWEDNRLWVEVFESLPNYRLSKFQSLMPPWVAREVVASYLLDVEGAWAWIAGVSAGGVDGSRGAEG